MPAGDSADIRPVPPHSFVLTDRINSHANTGSMPFRLRKPSRRTLWRWASWDARREARRMRSAPDPNYAGIFISIAAGFATFLLGCPISVLLGKYAEWSAIGSVLVVGLVCTLISVGYAPERSLKGPIGALFVVGVLSFEAGLAAACGRIAVVMSVPLIGPVILLPVLPRRWHASVGRLHSCSRSLARVGRQDSD